MITPYESSRAHSTQDVRLVPVAGGSRSNAGNGRVDVSTTRAVIQAVQSSTFRLHGLGKTS